MPTLKGATPEVGVSILISIIIPTYNERENLRELLRRIDNAMKSNGLRDYEVVIVDDNSPDGTADLAEELSNVYPVKVVRRPGKLGLSSAILDGLRVARGDTVVVMDADLQHPPEVIPKLVRAAESDGCDIVIASRYVKGGSVGDWSFLRKVISKGAILIAKILLPRSRGVRDPMSGFFLFRRSVVDGARNLNPKGFKILLEILVKGNYRRVCEVPYKFGRRFKGESKLSTKEMINYILHVLELSPSFIRFALVGGSGTLVNLGFLALERYVIGLPHVIAAPIAIEVSVINNFILNDIWTFKHVRRGSKLLRLVKFHGSSAAGILTQLAVSIGVYELLIHESIIAQIIGIIAGFILNYMISRRFVWREK